MTSVWDDPDLRSGGEFVKLDNKGDKIGGKILAVRAHRFDDNSVAPQIIFTDKIQGTGEADRNGSRHSGAEQPRQQPGTQPTGRRRQERVRRRTAVLVRPSAPPIN
jgi:hypothetical protein